jgi:Fe-Mn family superoxide dismutase
MTALLFPLLFAATPAAAPAAAPAPAAAAAPATAPFTLPPLPYAPEALAPIIDAETMRLHHGAHHRAFVDNLNRLVPANPALAGLSVEALLARASILPPAIRNNAGGHWNHRFFWDIMAPAGTGGAPSPALLAAINRDFGSLDSFKQQFEAAGMAQFGSGWVWLVQTASGKLVITTTANQDNPLMDSAAVRGTVLLANDLWEHAYYLSYRNRRAEYLAAWWPLVNWSRVSAHFAAAPQGAAQ